MANLGDPGTKGNDTYKANYMYTLVSENSMCIHAHIRTFLLLPHEHSWANHVIHVKQVKLFKSNSHSLHSHLLIQPSSLEGDRGRTGAPGEKT